MIQAGDGFGFALEARIARDTLLPADRANEVVSAETRPGCQAHHLPPVATFWFNCSGQFSTTLISPADCSPALSIRNLWPSGETS
jgi:hypothetical protein